MKLTAKEIRESTLNESSLWREEYQDYFDQLLDYPKDDYEYDRDEFGREVDTAEDRIYELADSMVSVYTGDQLAWYQEDIRRISYMDDYMHSVGSEDIYQILAGGLYEYHLEKLHEVHYVLKDFYDEWEEDDDEIYGEDDEE